MGKIILDPKLDTRKYGEQLEQLDIATYGTEADPTMQEIALAFPQLYRVLRRDDQVLGYTLAIPLKEDFFNAMKNGEVWEQNISVDDIDPSGSGLYIASIAASPKIKNKVPFLSGTLVGNLAERAISFNGEVIATPVTRTGENLARILSMSPTNNFPETNSQFKLKPRIWTRK